MANATKEQAKQEQESKQTPTQQSQPQNGERKTSVRIATDPSNFEMVDEIPPITRRGVSGPRRSKWDGVIEHLKANPGTKIKYEDVSASLGTDLSSRFLVKAETRDVTDDGRCTLYLRWDQEYADKKLAKREARAKAKAAEAAGA